jgi:hypothetical protein
VTVLFYYTHFTQCKSLQWSLKIYTGRWLENKVFMGLHNTWQFLLLFFLHTQSNFKCKYEVLFTTKRRKVSQEYILVIKWHHFFLISEQEQLLNYKCYSYCSLLQLLCEYVPVNSHTHTHTHTHTHNFSYFFTYCKLCLCGWRKCQQSKDVC